MEVVKLLITVDNKNILIRYIDFMGKAYSKLPISFSLCMVVFCLKEDSLVPSFIHAKICLEEMNMLVFKSDCWILQKMTNVKYNIILPENSDVKVAYHVLPSGDYVRFPENTIIKINDMERQLSQIYTDD
jgi:hypothetical protein